MKLLNSGNAKTKKGEKKGFITYGIHLAPYNLAGRNVCSHASAGCAAACLNTAGRGAMNSVQQARIAKTKKFFSNQKGFMQDLFAEIRAAIKSAAKKGMQPVFRLNLTSDLPWEKIKLDGQTVFEAFPSVQFYDYTKNPQRMSAFLAGDLPANYHLTFSMSETNGQVAMSMLQSGANVAMVFRNKLPQSYKGFVVVDGDETDLRFLDGRKVIVGLKEKGKAKKDETGFVIEA
jgi:hypothetical protein